jgi:UBX domain-containing protein 1
MRAFLYYSVPAMRFTCTNHSSRPENLSRPYTIGTTFPNRTLDDDNATIESAGLVNSVVVQRWV